MVHWDARCKTGDVRACVRQMRRLPLPRFLATVAIAFLLSGWIYLSHPGWFSNHSSYSLPTPPRSTSANATLPVPPAASPRPVPRATSTPTPSMPRVGTVQHLDGIWVTPRRVGHSQGAADILPNVGDEFLVVDLHIQNRSQSDYAVRASDFSVLDSHGQLASPLTRDFTRRHLRGEIDLIPQGYTDGTLIFETPLRDPSARLYYQPDALDPTKRKEWLLL